MRKAIADTGYQITPPIDRDYFWAVYFRTPGGVLFEVATAEHRIEASQLKETLPLEHQGCPAQQLNVVRQTIRAESLQLSGVQPLEGMHTGWQSLDAHGLNRHASVLNPTFVAEQQRRYHRIRL